MKPDRVLIVKTGDTLPEIRQRRGDFEDWIAAGMGLASDRVEVVAVHRDEPLPAVGPDPRATGVPAGVVVTGSSALVTDREPWSERTAAWLGSAVDAGLPILGICYGHQLLAHALGGKVARNPRGREIGTIELRRLESAPDDPLLSVLGPSEPAHATHVESIVRLPAGAVRLAESDGDPNQAFRLGESTWGVQFHPEFDADVVRTYIGARREVAAAEGLDPDALLRSVREAPLGSRLLQRFAELVRGASP